ncbi:MAG: hypothetical protein ABR533_04400, partial [Desulfonatronovibrio sp.]
MAQNPVDRYKTILLSSMNEINGYKYKFTSVNKRWDGAITAGLIETAHMPSEASMLFGPLIKDMRSTKSKFTQIQEQLINAIIQEAVNKIVSNITDQAKFAINILKRNLFERTADVGYLTTDSEIIDFLAKDFSSTDETEDYEKHKTFIINRLKDYQYEYTVYFDIIIMNDCGKVMARLDESQKVEFSRDDIVAQALSIDLKDENIPDKYVETFRPCDLFPGKKNVLIYTQKIEDPIQEKPLGVLCLCFNFEEEMEGIFNDLLGLDRKDKATLCIIDEQDIVIGTSNEDTLATGSKVSKALDEEFRVVNYKGRQYFTTSVRTEGYQGFYGLPWYGHAMIPLGKSLNNGKTDSTNHESLMSKLDQFAPELSSIKQEADDILDDMDNDGLNGQVKAARFQADGFVEVLR